MTHSVSPAHSAPTSDAAPRRARGNDQADRSSFALLLNVQLAAKIPELVGRERLSDRQLEAQERREERRTGRADAQDRRARDAAASARIRDSSHAARTGIQSRSTGAHADAAGDGAGSVRPNMGQPNTFGLPASDPAAARDAGSSASRMNSENDGATEHRSANARGGVTHGGFNAILSRTATTSQSADSPVAKTISGVSSAKGGGATSAHHGLTASRIAGRFNATRVAHGRAPSPSSQARPFQYDQHKVLMQVGRGLAAALRREGGVVTLRLEPAALGKLKIRLDLNQGRVSATFRVENETARQLLQSSLDTLRSSLEMRGLSVERLHVDLRESLAQRQQAGSHDEPREYKDTSGGDREQRGDGDPPEQRSRTDHREASGDSRVQGDAEQSAQQSVRFNAGTAEDFQAVSGLRPGADEVIVRVRLDAVA